MHRKVMFFVNPAVYARVAADSHGRRNNFCCRCTYVKRQFLKTQNPFFSKLFALAI
jgi:hypothetical protein